MAVTRAATPRVAPLRSSDERDGRTSRRRNGRTFTLDDILSAATQEFAKRGYRGTNLAHVSKRLGVTRQALYYYYPRKHDLLKAISTSFFDVLDARVREAARSSSSAADRFTAMLAAHFATVAERPLLMTVFVHEEPALARKVRDDVMRRRREHQRLFTEAYKAGVREGAFVDSPPGPTVGILLGAGNWAYRWFKPKGGTMSSTDFARFATDLLRDGFAAGRGDARPRRASRR